MTQTRTQEIHKKVRLSICRNSRGSLCITVDKMDKSRSIRVAGHADGFGASEVQSFVVDPDTLKDAIDEYTETENVTVITDSFLP